MLTAKQERFAQSIAEGNTMAAAYRSVCEAKGMQDSTVWKEASKLARHPEVAMRVQVLKGEADALSARWAAYNEKRAVLDRTLIYARSSRPKPTGRLGAFLYARFQCKRFAFACCDRTFAVSTSQARYRDQNQEHADCIACPSTLLLRLEGCERLALLLKHRACFLTGHIVIHAGH